MLEVRGNVSRSMLLLPLLILIGTLVTEQAAGQTVLRVDGDAPGGGDGSSWKVAYDDLVLALASAAEIAGPVEIWVAQNTYLPDSGSGDITRSFEISGDLRLLGGFAGDETTAEERDPATHETTLSGDLLGDDLPAWLQRADNSLHVVIARDLSAPSVIDGFALSGGNADFAGGDLLGGGAVFVERADLELRRCFFSENTAGTEAPTLGNFGAAVYAKGSGTVTIDTCRFQHNRANNGGAIGTLSRDGGSVDLSITDSICEENVVPTQSGGALRFVGRSLFIEGCEFNDQRAGYGAAIHSTLAEQVVIRNSTFARNVADVKTPAIWLERSDNLDATPAVIERCRFLENWTDRGLPGGTIHLEETITHMSHCEILGNFNLRVDPQSGAIEGAGTIMVDFESGHRFINCLVADNFAGFEGGFVLDRAAAEFVNCTVARNRAAADSPFASGILAYRSTLGVENTVLWGNRLGTGEDDDQPGFGGELAQISLIESTLTINHSDVEGWSGGHGGMGNIGDDPLFVAEDNRDFHVLGGSPAIDAGDNAVVPADLLLDLDGNPRIADGDDDEISVVDMGVYEFPGAVVNVGPDSGIAEGGLFLAIRRQAGSLSVNYRLPRDSRVELAVFDLRGRRLRVLARGPKTHGEHRVAWDEADAAGRRVASGMYIIRLTADGDARNQRIVLVR